MKQMTRKKFDEAVKDKQLVMDDEQLYSMIYVVQTAQKREGFHMLAVFGFTERNSDANPNYCQLLGYANNVVFHTGELTDSMELHCDSHMNGVTRYWITFDRAKFLVDYTGGAMEITCVPTLTKFQTERHKIAEQMIKAATSPRMVGRGPRVI